MPAALADRHRPLPSFGEQTDHYAEILSDLVGNLSPDWVVRQYADGVITWYALQPRATSLPNQGWKLHVSASHTEAVELCHRVLPLLVSAKASFKILRDTQSIIALNSGHGGTIQIGKVLTLYDSPELDFAMVIRKLAQVWSGDSGPKVPSDLEVSGASGLFLRYGAIAPSRVMVDRLGRHAFVLRTPDGAAVPDQRNAAGLQPGWAMPPPVPYKTPSEIDIDSRFCIANEVYMPMVYLNGSVRGATYLGIHLKSGRSVILKTAVRGIPHDLSGRDAVDLLQREYEILSEVALRAEIAPKPLGFESADVPLLALEDFRGDSLDEMPRDAQIALLPGLADALAELHAIGYVHGDIKLSNAVAVNHHVRLVDFGLAGRLGHRDVSGGTRNYIPPEGVDVPAEPAGDVFSVGVAIAGAFLDIDPATLPAPPLRVLGLLRLMNGGGGIADLVESTLKADPGMRPTALRLANQLRSNLGHSRAGRHPSAGRESAKPRVLSPGRNWCLRAAASAAAASRQFLERDGETGWWRNGHMESAFPCEGINLGAAGIILGLVSVDHTLGRNDYERDVICGCNWLSGRRPSQEALGLFSGDAGVALALAVAGRRYGRDDWTAAARTRLDNAANVIRDYDLFSGASGVVYAASVLARILDEEWASVIGARMVHHLLGAGRVIDGLRVWPAFDELEEPLTGAAHGCAGVALALAEWSKCSSDTHARNVALDVFSRLFAHGRTADDGLIRSLDATPTEDRLWCHGAAGYLWCLLVGLGDDPLLRGAVDWSAEQFFSSAVLTSPVYCHGLAGQLDLCRLLGRVERLNARAQERAALIVATLRLLAERRSGDTVWMSEEPETITPDLWVGFLGPAVALARDAAIAEGSMFSPEWFIACSKPLDR
jgi:hypothetical protein